MQPEMQDEKLRRRAAEDKLAQDIVDECRVQLMLKFRFMDRALWRMEYIPMRVGAAYGFATDGAHIICDPPLAIGRFKQSTDEVIRDYLHSVMHCIFRQPFSDPPESREAYSLMCDMITESAAMDICAGRFPSVMDDARKEELSEIAMLCGKVTPHRLYELLRNAMQMPDGKAFRGIDASKINTWRALFERDEHAAWPALSKADKNGDSNIQGEPQDPSEDDTSQDNADQNDIEMQQDQQQGQQDQPDQQMQPLPQEVDPGSEDSDDTDSQPQSGGEDEDSALNDADGKSPENSENKPEDSDDWIPNMNPDLAEKDWEDISKEMEMNLDTFSREWGDAAGTLKANLAIANRKKYDYTEFLRKFMIQTEEIKVNHDEFDYIYYTYGMDLFRNMPLIEPLEYKETDRVHDFVIAIDTSESVSGDLVKRFVMHTFGILKSSPEYARDVNIHIVQCDSKVQSDMHITDMREVDRMMENFTVRGFGGTDFRPVFDYVEGMRKDGKLPDMKGLIYFTDGIGQFPEKAPDFDAAFVFMDDGEHAIPSIPPWAMKVVIDEESLLR